MTHWQKYTFTFIITAIIFVGAILLNDYFNNKRIGAVSSIQDTIRTDIQSNEIQYELLSELSCREVGADILSQEIGNLGQKIEYMEQSLGAGIDEIDALKKQYAILQVKDYILMKRINERCGKQFMFALYFYGKKRDCSDCERTGVALTSLRESYPDLRVYSFDYGLDDAVVRTLIQIFDVKSTLPAIIFGDTVHYGFKDKDNLETILRKTYPKEIAALEAEKKKKAEENALEDNQDDVKKIQSK